MQKGNDNVHDPNNPDSYSWCLMNLGIVQLVQKVIRSTVSLTGMEVLGIYKLIMIALTLNCIEFITASPIIYRLLSLLEDWETAFTHQLNEQAFSVDLFPHEDSQQATFGPALMRHKFILEPEHSPFRLVS